MEYYQRGGEPFAGRHAIEAYERIIRGGIIGVLQTEGEVWREHRRFVLHVFRDFGVGKNVMQERVRKESFPSENSWIFKILTEIVAMFKILDSDLEQTVGDDVNIVRHFERAISSIINALLVGFRFDEQHEQEYHQLNDQLWAFNNRMQSFATNLFMWKPDIFKSWPKCRDAYNLVRRTHELFFGFFDRQIERHLELLEKQHFVDGHLDDQPAIDYMEAFLREKLKRDALSEEHSYRLAHAFAFVQ